MISVKNLNKSYKIGGKTYHVIQDIDLHVNQGEFIAIMGPSGSGKSTFLNLLGGLDIPDTGEIILNDTNINSLTARERTLFRRKSIGFVFQNYQLLPNLTTEENIAFPMYSDKIKKKKVKKVVSELIDSVGLKGKEKNYPSQLSGGQQQRISIARSLSMNPNVILADEPTGNLDRKTGTEVLKLLSSLRNQTVLMVTHDIYAASYANRIILLKDGVIETDRYQTEGEQDNVLADIFEKLNS